MGLRLCVGVSRKVGLPEFSSMGACCNVEVELDPGWLEHDLDSVPPTRPRGLFACHQAVEDELARARPAPAPALAGTGRRPRTEPMRRVPAAPTAAPVSPPRPVRSARSSRLHNRRPAWRACFATTLASTSPRS